jgi:hypothetical protein
MKYIVFTYIDKKTRISALKQPSIDELVLPDIDGISVEWSQSLTIGIPYLFGTCSDFANTDVEGFLKEITEQEWNTLKQEHILNTFNCPKLVNNSNFRLTLLQNNLLDIWQEAVKTLPKEIQIYWEYSVDVDRTSSLVQQAGRLLNLFEIDPDSEETKIDMLFNESTT